MDGCSFRRTVLAALILCTVIGALSYGDHLYGALLGSALLLAGLGPGTAVFRISRRICRGRDSMLLRILCAVVALLPAFCIGWWTGWGIYYLGNGDRLEAGQKLAFMNLGLTAIIGALVAGTVGAMFGAGLGQRTRRDCKLITDD